MISKRLIRGAVLWGLVAMAVFLFARGCNYSARYEQAMGELKMFKQIVKADRAMMEKVIIDQQKRIAELDRAIDQANQRIIDNLKKIDKYKDRTSQLEREYTSLTDKDEMIANLQLQVSVWKEKFNLAEKVITEKDAIIFSLSEKYRLQFRISEGWKTALDEQAQLLRMTEMQLALANKKINRCGLTNAIQTIAIIAAGGFIIQQLFLGGDR